MERERKLNVFSPQSPLVFFPALSLALFFARAPLSERLEQAMAMAVGSSRRQFTSVDSSIVKGPIRLRDSRGQNLAADMNSCERDYQALF